MICVFIAGEPDDTSVRDWLVESVIDRINETKKPIGEFELSDEEYKDNEWTDIKKNYQYQWYKFTDMTEPELIIAPDLTENSEWFDALNNYEYEGEIKVEPRS